MQPIERITPKFLYRLCDALKDVFPHITHVGQLGMQRASDLEIWQYARDNNCTIVTHDSDFHDLSLLRGAPPQIIWLRCGNQATEDMKNLLQYNAREIENLMKEAAPACLEIWSFKTL